jgi:hypothetical protein
MTTLFPNKYFIEHLVGMQETIMGAQLEQGKLDLFLSDDSRTILSFTCKNLLSNKRSILPYKHIVKHMNRQNDSKSKGEPNCFSPCSKAGLWLSSGQRSSYVSNVVSPGFISTSPRHSMLMRSMFSFSINVWI